ncbi:MAG: beta-ketoacyl-ACP synthase I [Pseudomonadota bacterium]
MKRVVITGLGIVSCIGNDKSTVTNALREARSGISSMPEYASKGFRSQVAGVVDLDIEALIERKARRFMGKAAAYAFVSAQQAIADAELPPEMVSNYRTGIVMGTGGASTWDQYAAVEAFEQKGLKRVGPYVVPKTMCSTASACLATPLKIKGINYSISSACATSAHCIGHGYEQIQMGKQDIVLAGGGEEESWILTMMFDAMGALSSKYNDNPSTASRPYDANRDGFVISSGGGCVILEEYEHAKARGAKIYGELVGYGATSDGHDMVAPSGEGAIRCMQQALSTVEGTIDYINTHGTSTPVGDVAEIKALKEVFGSEMPLISSTKSLTGHSLGATGVHEFIFGLLMMENNFVASSANIEQLDADAEGLPILTSPKIDHPIHRFLTNSFGFGGTNATLVAQRV